MRHAQQHVGLVHALGFLRVALGDAALGDAAWMSSRPLAASPQVRYCAPTLTRASPVAADLAAASFLASAAFSAATSFCAAASRRLFTSTSRCSTKTFFVKPCSSTVCASQASFSSRASCAISLYSSGSFSTFTCSARRMTFRALDVVRVALAQRLHEVLPVLGLRVVHHQLFEHAAHAGVVAGLSQAARTSSSCCSFGACPLARDSAAPRS